MNINLHYGEAVGEAEIEILKNIGIEPKIVCSDFVVFDLIEGSEEQIRLKNKFPDWKGLPDYVFSDEDMDEAEWFTARSTNWKLENCALEKTFEYSCKTIVTPPKVYGHEEPFVRYIHQVQAGPFYFKKPIKWGRNFFYACDNRGLQTLFCNDVAMSILTKAELRGITFNPVLLFKNESVMENVHQVSFDETIPDSHVRISGDFYTLDCPVCGKAKYVVPRLSRPMVDRSKLGDKDFYTTQDSYTYDRYPYPTPYWIASKKAYLTIKNNRLDNTLEFSPLLLY